MNGIHDMGGMHGFGPIDVADDASFHEDWEPRARAIAHLMFGTGYLNLDEFRSTIEHVLPVEYLQSSYFDRWLTAVESASIERGYLTRDELDGRIQEIQGDRFQPAIPAPNPAPPEDISIGDVVQRFQAGDTVRVRNAHVEGHTRAPRYLRGKVGVIQKSRGHEVFPDTNAHLQGDRPQVVYSVTFAGSELWGDQAEPRQLLTIDLWDAYLERA